MRKIFAALVVAAALVPAVGHADDSHHKKGAAAGDAAPGAMVDGEVRKVDKDAKKITIRHAPIASLDMPAHTMVFQVSDAAMLDQVKAGDKVRFQAEKVGGAFRLTKIERAN